ncbi:hypothetical protein [Roseibium sp. RKSG952]|uniref:hypothetical protein n=1 Tax=Roseibium sp. RKSG952 TaxID=2529384 RepID=UPI0018AD1B64|nr:hypothetical protein [Roseibium sp. RKSG952]
MKRPHRSAHALIWSVLAFALPLALFLVLALRQTVPVDRPAVRISAPAGEVVQ